MYWGIQVAGLVSLVVKDKRIHIGPALLRKLTANATVFATTDAQLTRGVAYLAGHSPETVEKVYRDKMPSSEVLSASAQHCCDAIAARRALYHTVRFLYFASLILY